MLLGVLNTCTDEELSNVEAHPVALTEEDEEKMKRREHLRGKIRAVGRMSHALNKIREERESIIQLKGLMGTNKLPAGTILSGKNIHEGAFRSI